MKDLKFGFQLKKACSAKLLDNKSCERKFRTEERQNPSVGRGVGCGKTTTGKAIIQLIKNTEGSIFYKGKR